MSSSRYFMNTSNEGSLLFHGNFSHIFFTGYHFSINKLLKIGILFNPSTSETFVFCKVILNTFLFKLISLARVITLPPKVGNNLNHPKIGIVVNPKIVVSNVDINSRLVKFIF